MTSIWRQWEKVRYVRDMLNKCDKNSLLNLIYIHTDSTLFCFGMIPNLYLATCF